MQTTQVRDWLPKSIQALRNYDKHKFLSDLHCRRDRGIRRRAAGHGLCHRLGHDAAGGPVLRRRRRLSDLGVRRIFHANRRTDGRVRRRGVWNRRPIRRGRPVPVHAAGRHYSGDSGRHRTGHGGQVHSPPSRGGIHQRHRRHHRQHADQGFLRPARGQCSRRILGPDEGARRRVPDNFAAGNGDLLAWA